MSLAKRNCVDGGLGGVERWRGGELTELSSTFPLSFNLLLELNTPKLSQVLSMCVPVSEYHYLIPHNPIVLVAIAKKSQLVEKQIKNCEILSRVDCRVIMMKGPFPSV